MYNNSKRAVLFPLVLALGVAAGALFGVYVGRNTAGTQLRDLLMERLAEPDNKLTQTLSLIESRYVDPVSMDSLAEHVIPLLIGELDPHSVYVPAEEMAAMNEPLEGEFDGIGVMFNMATDTVIVLNVIPRVRATRRACGPATASWRSTIRWSPGAAFRRTASSDGCAVRAALPFVSA